MLGFIGGCIVGGTIGAILMGILQINKEDK